MEQNDKMELVLLNPKEEGFLQHIEWNNAQIKTEVERMMTAYTDVAYTEDTMKQAKEDRAFLNKFSKSIDDRRKAVKAKCMEPYEQFEKEVKEVLDLIKKPAAMIDAQIKAFEEQQKQEKKDKLEAVYREHIEDLEELFGFDKIFIPQYLNASYSLKKASEDIIGKIERIKTDLRSIDTFCGKYKTNAKDVYIQTLDVSKAMAEESRLKELDAKLEAERIRKEEEAERKREQEAAAKAEQARLEKEKEEVKEPPYKRGCITGKNPNGNCVCCGKDGTVECCSQCDESCNGRCGWLDVNAGESVSQPTSTIGQVIQGIEKQAFEAAMNAPAEPPKAKRYKATFCAIGTIEQLNKLKAFMTSEGIEFGKVGK